MSHDAALQPELLTSVVLTGMLTPCIQYEWRLIFQPLISLFITMGSVNGFMVITIISGFGLKGIA